ncbi:cadherin-like domain-containing protein [Candidatus Reidiella endopervernicosa]|uniref:Cadherin-like domain-containing protein n=1 Tax=Candidatus Reidiella endopervernicosa TaxID=2738883 RepID=A0A6N0HWQ3_9GAMM|nr:cadherin-like domain-containing protein [Candidatus Reidiella endopervernicosa]
MLANDSDTESPSNALTATTGTIATSKGGSVTMSSNGSFVYTPPANISSDSFQYTLNDNDGVDPNSDVGTANISLSGMVWYVDDSAAAGGDGTSENHLTLLQLAQRQHQAQRLSLYILAHIAVASP